MTLEVRTSILFYFKKTSPLGNEKKSSMTHTKDLYGVL